MGRPGKQASSNAGVLAASTDPLTGKVAFDAIVKKKGSTGTLDGCDEEHLPPDVWLSVSLSVYPTGLPPVFSKHRELIELTADPKNLMRPDPEVFPSRKSENTISLPSPPTNRRLTR